jgi:hypothetical protein
LRENFAFGRILEKNSSYIKANLMLRTQLTEEELFESFFHCELWNDRIKKYQLINRIDEGIYLVYMEFHRTRIFSAPKYCYLMATSIIVGKQPHFIFKSLE